LIEPFGLEAGQPVGRDGIVVAAVGDRHGYFAPQKLLSCPP
jgi:hypothetical protein